MQNIRGTLLSLARKLAEQRHPHERDQDVFELAADLMARRPAVNAVYLAVSIGILGELICSASDIAPLEFAGEPPPVLRSRVRPPSGVP